MNYWFTSDEHYSHHNIIKYCNRPFKDVDEMDHKLATWHNQLVGMNDVVFHLGDFTLLRKEDQVKPYIDRLNGVHYFVQGSHDNFGPRDLPYIIEQEFDGIYVVMCHYAMRTWPKSHHGSLLAYGHSHGKLPVFPNAWDVGVDNNNYRPVSLKEFIKRCKQHEKT